VNGSTEVVEYVGGPWAGTTEERSDLPETIQAADGRYARSARCVEDGAMRYVWHASELAEPGHPAGVKEG
jgi:hypothetical protein